MYYLSHISLTSCVWWYSCPCTQSEGTTVPVHKVKVQLSLYKKWRYSCPCTQREGTAVPVHKVKVQLSLYTKWRYNCPCTQCEGTTVPVHNVKVQLSLYTKWRHNCPCTQSERTAVPVPKVKVQLSLYTKWRYSCPCTQSEGTAVPVRKVKVQLSLYTKWRYNCPCTQREGTVVPVHKVKKYRQWCYIPLVHLCASSFLVVSFTPRPLYSRHPLNSRLCGLHILFACFGLVESLLHLPGIETRLLGFTTCSRFHMLTVLSRLPLAASSRLLPCRSCCMVLHSVRHDTLYQTSKLFQNEQCLEL
jgi:hypothetical protein